MPYLRATITISAGFLVNEPNKESAIVAREHENIIRENLDDWVKRLLSFARGPGGTITWKVEPAQDPDILPQNISEPKS